MLAGGAAVMGEAIRVQLAGRSGQADGGQVRPRAPGRVRPCCPSGWLVLAGCQAVLGRFQGWQCHGVRGALFAFRSWDLPDDRPSPRLTFRRGIQFLAAHSASSITWSMRSPRSIRSSSSSSQLVSTTPASRAILRNRQAVVLGSCTSAPVCSSTR